MPLTPLNASKSARELGVPRPAKTPARRPPCRKWSCDHVGWARENQTTARLTDCASVRSIGCRMNQDYPPVFDGMLKEPSCFQWFRVPYPWESSNENWRQFIPTFWRKLERRRLDILKTGGKSWE